MYLEWGVLGKNSPAGEFAGQRPSRFCFSNAPARTQRGGTKNSSPKPVAGQAILAGAFGGKGGSAPDRCANAKTGVWKLTFASVTPTLIEKK
jgi:hypothetical protein